ncbi:MAG: hypothetical protein PHW04_05275 [Candidatus Wallbacteria bacterium]|nr:hypothetical protein [Candidatus Wallbacteria bacterium]
MKARLLIILLFSSILAFAAYDMTQIQDLVDKMQQKGMTDIKLIYDWGDGSQAVLPITKLSEGSPDHFYEKEGKYKITLKISYRLNGKAQESVAEQRNFVFKSEKLDCNLQAVVPAEADENSPVSFSGKLIFKEQLSVKNLKYQWVTDEEYNQYEEGENATHNFPLPNGDTKPFYSVKLKVIFKYQKSDLNAWFPYELTKEFKIRIRQKEKLSISGYTEKIKMAAGKYTEPFFLVIRDHNIYNSEEFYTDSKLVYRPVVFQDGKPEYPEFVTLRSNIPLAPPYLKDDFYTEITYLLEFDKIQPSIQTENGKRFVNLTIKVNDPQGQIVRDAKIEME